MSFHSQQLRLSYFSVPKCACSTLKQFLFEWENGFPFRTFAANGKRHNIHNFLPSRSFDVESDLVGKSFLKVTVIRDTVARIVSCYRNRVAAWNGNIARRRAQEFGKAGLLAEPTLNEFVESIDSYRAASRSVEHHSMPLSYFLGTDASYFDRIFTVGQLDEFVAEVSRRTVHVPILRHLQAGGSDTSETELSEENVARLKEKYAEDYEVFGSYFQAA